MPSSVESQALWVAYSPWWSYELFHGKFHGWSRDLVRPHDGALFVGGCRGKEGLEKKKREGKRGLSRFPQPSSLMKNRGPRVGLSPQFSHSRTAATSTSRMSSVGSQE